MNRLLRVTQTIFNKLFQLEVKAISARGTYTAEEYGPYGTDARCVKDTTVLYTTTERDGDEAIFGCLNKNRKSEEGEHRLFCTDANGNFKFNLWLRSDGTLLQGTSDIPSEYTNYAVMYNELKADLDAFKQSHNSLVNAFNSHMHATAGTGSPSPPTPIPTIIPVQPNTTDFSNIKNEKIKTNP
jgi:hypothetical protein